MLKALHGWYQWKAEIESNLEVPSIQSTFWVMWRKFNIKLSHSVFTWPLFVRKCLFFQTNQPFTQTCDICTHIVSYMVGKLLKRSTFLRTQLHRLRFRIKWNMAAIWIFSRHAVFGDFSTPKTKSGFGIKLQNWINLSSGTDFLSLPKLLTEIWPFKPHF